jgi:hypothetical protein
VRSFAIVPALLAIAVITPLLYIPGYIIEQALLPLTLPSDLLERHFQRVVIGALLNGWLAFTLAEFGVFSTWLHLMLLSIICATALVVARRRGGWPARSAPLGIIAGSRMAPNAASTRAWLIVHWDVAVFAAVGILFIALISRPFEVILGARDAGVYATTGFAIAQHGGIVQYDPLLAQIGQDQQSDDPYLRAAAEQAETNFLGSQKPDRTIATRLHNAGFFINEGDLERGRIVPQGFHLYPVWIALLAGLLGFEDGLLATGLMGFLGLWSVGMLGRRLAGSWVGFLAIALLALNGAQVWFSRYSTAETTAQFLTFAGLYAFAVMNMPAASTAQGRSCFPLAALIGGLAFGQLALVRIDFLAILPLLFAYILYIWLTRRWSLKHTVFVASLAVMLLQAALHIVFIARAYFFDTLFARLQDYAVTAFFAMPFLTQDVRNYYMSREDNPFSIRLGNARGVWDMQRVATELIIVALALVTIFTLRRWGFPLLLMIECWLRRWSFFLLNIGAVAILLFAFYGYVIRPQVLSFESLSALPGCLTPQQARQPEGVCLALQGYIGAPVAVATHPNELAYFLDTLPERLRGDSIPSRESTKPLDDTVGIAQANMVRVGWYLSPLGVVLGVVGFALWWRRGMSPASWLFFTIAVVTAWLFIRQSYGSGNQTYIYILRRYIPQVYPVFYLSIAYALVGMAQWATRSAARSGKASRGLLIARRLSLGFSAVCLLTLLAFAVFTNRTIYRHVEYGGAIAQLQSVANRFDAQDVLLFRGGDHRYDAARDIPDLVVTPLRYAYNRNAFTIKSKEPGNYAESIARYIRRWQGDGRDVYLVLGASGAVGLPGFALEPAGKIELALREFEPLTDQKPSNIQDLVLDFRVYRVIPADQPAAPASIAVDDYASQVRGFYRPETNADTAPAAWTNGDALLRLPRPAGSDSLKLTLQFAAGKRPAALPPAQVCVSMRAEPGFWVEDPAAPAFAQQQCVTLVESMQGYTFTFDPIQIRPPDTATLLLRIESTPWTPANIPSDPPSNDLRSLGIQFGGLTVEEK